MKQQQQQQQQQQAEEQRVEARSATVFCVSRFKPDLHGRSLAVLARLSAADAKAARIGAVSS
jgi:hypothetical protein